MLPQQAGRQKHSQGLCKIQGPCHERMFYTFLHTQYAFRRHSAGEDQISCSPSARQDGLSLRMVPSAGCSLLQCCVPFTLVSRACDVLAVLEPSVALTTLCCVQVQQLQGVYSLQEPHFWTLCSDVYIGTVKLLVAPDADSRWLLSQTHHIFTQVAPTPPPPLTLGD